MLRFTALTIMLAHIVLGVFGHPVREANTTEAHPQNPYGHDLDKKTKCQMYMYVHVQLNMCQDHLHLAGELTTNYVLDSIEHTCSNSVNTKECMKSELLDCENWPEIEKIVDMTTDICNTFMQDNIKQFLTDNSNVTLTMGCLRTIWDETKDYCYTEERPKLDEDDNSLEKVQDYTQRMFEWILKCVATNEHLDMAMQVCNGLTRRKVYGILVSTIAALNPGFNLNSVYPAVLAYINDPAAQLLQQAIYQIP